MLTDLNMAGRVTLFGMAITKNYSQDKVYTGSRHTFNSQFVLVETGVSRIVLASDNIWVYYSLEHMRPPSTGGTF